MSHVNRFQNHESKPVVGVGLGCAIDQGTHLTAAVASGQHRLDRKPNRLIGFTAFVATVYNLEGDRASSGVRRNPRAWT